MAKENVLGARAITRPSQPVKETQLAHIRADPIAKQSDLLELCLRRRPVIRVALAAPLDTRYPEPSARHRVAAVHMQRTKIFPDKGYRLIHHFKHSDVLCCQGSVAGDRANGSMS